MNINREEMLELTRRMTVKRNCFTRLAGAYMDVDGFEEGSFNTHLLVSIGIVIVNYREY